MVISLFSKQAVRDLLGSNERVSEKVRKRTSLANMVVANQANL